jgi:hypothetical protein
MTRVRTVTALALAALVSAACADNLLKERPTAKAVHTPAPKVAFSAIGSAQGSSSVCAAYRRQLRVTQLKQRLSPPRTVADELKARELSLNAVIADACE